MSITPYSSEKIKIISFFSILLVVFLHAYNLGDDTTETPLFFGSPLWYFEDAISNGITRIAVPLFFIFSGFLFYLNMDGENVFQNKIKKRFRTLFVPFLFWSLAGIALYFTLQSVPQTAVFFTKEKVVDFSAMQWLNKIFVQPVPYQFWFIRDLMVLVLFSPLLYRILRFAGQWWLLLVAIPWVVVDNGWQNSIEACLFFCCGGFLAVRQPDRINQKTGDKAIVLVLVWLVLIAAKSALLAHYFDAALVRIVYKTSILTGVFAIWAAYDRWFAGAGHSKSIISNCCAFTFFIFAAHEPILTIFKKILFVIFGKQENSYLAGYLTAPLLTISGVILLGWLMRKYLRGFYEIITGGR